MKYSGHGAEKPVKCIDEMEVVGRKGKCKEEGIETAYRKWCDYRRTYWKLRGTKNAYPKDYMCEISIPVGAECQACGE